MPPQDKNTPEGREPKPKEGGPPAQAGIDLDKILLPKKEVHDPKNAERINAGALLAQEEGATLLKPEPPPAPQPPKPKEEELMVRPIETYQGDIEKLVQKKNVSSITIAAAEATRRTEAPPPTPAASGGQRWLIRVLILTGAFILFVGALLVLIFAFSLIRPLPPIENTQGSLIFVDDAQAIVIAEVGTSRAAFMQALMREREASALSLGLIGEFYITQASTTPEGKEVYIPFNAQQFISLLSIVVPAELVRTIRPTPYLLGVHSFEDNQAFLILEVDSYQQGYSGMLKWEESMERDLTPLFTRTTRMHIPEENISTSTPPASQVLRSKFVDTVVEGRDVRAILNESGDTLLLWTFLDQDTVLITTNPNTLREIVSRFTTAPGTI